MRTRSALFAVRLLHTAVWAFFASCIVVLPYAAHAGRFGLAAVLVAAVLVEVAVLALNGWVCPLTPIAARYTNDRQANFDIFLPLWMAKYNKQIFGALFILGVAYTVFRWWSRPV